MLCYVYNICITGTGGNFAPNDKNLVLIIAVSSAVGALAVIIVVVCCSSLCCCFILCKKKDRKNNSTRIWCVESDSTTLVTDKVDTDANFKKSAEKHFISIENGVCGKSGEGIVTIAKSIKDKDNTAACTANQQSSNKQGEGMVTGAGLGKAKNDVAACTAKKQSPNKQGEGTVTGAKLGKAKNGVADCTAKQWSSNKQGEGTVTGAKSGKAKNDVPDCTAKKQSSNKQGEGMVTGAKAKNDVVDCTSKQWSSNKQGEGIVTGAKSVKYKDEAATCNAKQQLSSKQCEEMVSGARSGKDNGDLGQCTTKQQSRCDSPKATKVGTTPNGKVTTKDKQFKPVSTTPVSRTIPEKGADAVFNKLKVNRGKNRMYNGVAGGGPIQVQNTSFGLSVAYRPGRKPTRTAPAAPLPATSSLHVLPTSTKLQAPVNVSVPVGGYKNSKSPETQCGRRT